METGELNRWCWLNVSDLPSHDSPVRTHGRMTQRPVLIPHDKVWGIRGTQAVVCPWINQRMLEMERVWMWLSLSAAYTHTHSSNLFRKKLHQRSAVWIITHPLREENGWIFLNESVFYLIVLNVHKASLYPCLFRKTKWRTWHEEIDSLWMLQLKGLYFTAIVFLQSRVHVNECRNYQWETFFEFRVEGVN